MTDTQQPREVVAEDFAAVNSGSYAGEEWQARVDLAAILRMLEEAKETGGWVAQELLRPHPDIADIALDALPTARITTILDEHGEDVQHQDHSGVF